jgi:tocopherol O-methyltransferase
MSVIVATIDEVLEGKKSATVGHVPASAAHAHRVISFYERSNAGNVMRRRRTFGPAMHLGFWEKTTHRNTVALRNMDRLLARRAGLRSGDRVFDAGCGYGRSAVWLAREYGVEVVGINLVREQIQRASSYAHTRSVAHKVAFE